MEVPTAKLFDLLTVYPQVKVTVVAMLMQGPNDYSWQKGENKSKKHARKGWDARHAHTPASSERRPQLNYSTN